MRKTSNDYLTISDFKPAENQMLYLTDDIVVSGSLSNVPNSDGQHFQMGFFSIINCLKGKIHIEVNGKPYEMTANDFLFIFPSMQINYVETSRGE